MIFKKLAYIFEFAFSCESLFLYICVLSLLYALHFSDILDLARKSLSAKKKTLKKYTAIECRSNTFTAISGYIKDTFDRDLQRNLHLDACMSLKMKYRHSTLTKA